MKYGIFGGAGFVGRYLVRALLRQGHEVDVADSLEIVPAEPLPERAVLHKLDVRRRHMVRKYLDAERPDVVVWLPAKQGYKPAWSKYARTQVLASYNFFEGLSRLDYRPQKILLASSQAVYRPGRRLDEQSPTIPPSTYGWTKLQQEQVFRYYSRRLEIPIMVMRYSIILGRGQSLHANESGILRNWFRSLINFKQPEIYGDGLQVRDFVHIKDVTAANLLALDYGGLCDTFNICGVSSSVKYVFQLWRQHTGCFPANVLGEDRRPGGEFSLTSSGALAGKELQWRPSLGIEEQIADFMAGVADALSEDNLLTEKTKRGE